MTEKKPEDTVADALLKLDADAREAVIPHQQDVPVKALSWYSEIGDQPQIRILSSGLFLAGAAARNRRMMRAGARMLVAHELATVAKNFIKNRVDRTRPRSAQDEEDQKAELGENSDKEETSFPSGHSAGATAAACAFAREFPELRIPAFGAAGVAALAQIPRCAHYPTDVGAGIAIGAAAEAVVNLAWNAVAPEAEEEC
jgi:membrane-associated phospholipid phosphatase